MYNEPSFSDSPAVQGFAPDEVIAHTSLRSGLVAPSQTSPLWGGMAVTLSLPGPGVPLSLGPMLSLATASSNIAAFTSFTESDAMSRSIQNTVPQARAGDGTNPGGAINFLLLRSGARLWVKIHNDAVSALDGGSITPTVYWDYANQQLSTRAAIANDSPISVTLLRLEEHALVITRRGCWADSGCAALIQI